MQKGGLKCVKTVKGRIGLNLVSNSELIRPSNLQPKTTLAIKKIES